MNVKQFISSMVLQGLDLGVAKFPIVGKILAIPFRIVFPTMFYERVNTSLMRASVFISIFAIGFLVCFVLQAYLAHLAGYLWPSNELGERIVFSQDFHNLFNYIILVPLYLVAGTGFAISLFSLRERMEPITGGYGFQLDDGIKPYLSGMTAIGVFFVLLTLMQAQYAEDMKKSEFLY